MLSAWANPGTTTIITARRPRPPRELADCLLQDVENLSRPDLGYVLRVRENGGATFSWCT